MLIANPIEAWVGGRGTGAVSYFGFDGGVFSSKLTLSDSVVSTAQELVRELVDWRLAEYFQRPGRGSTSEFVLKVSHSDGKPILFLPAGETHLELPEGWTNLRVNDETLNANFVKVAINVIQRADKEVNVLPEIIHGWFGADAGKP